MNLPTPLPAPSILTLSPFLQRPNDLNSLAKLTLVHAEEKPDGSGGARWHLNGAPAVVLMAEKLFSGARPSKRHDALSWPCVEAMFEDLLMLQHRFPITIGQSAVATWEDQYSDFLASRMILIDQEPHAEQPRQEVFKGILRPFQKEGVRFLRAHRKALLADDMGLGKTPTALAALAEHDEWPAVIVCQSHVQRHWERKIEEFLDIVPAGSLASPNALTWKALRGLKVDRSVPKADIYLVHYLIMGVWESWLKARGIKAVIFDEAQELRHPGTRKHEATRSLARSAKIVIGLSGTPIYNKGAEIYNVMNTINRGCLGTRVDFVRDWCNPHDVYQVETPEVLGQYLTDRGLMLRRRKEDVLTELPAKRRVMEAIDADNGKFAELVKAAIQLARDAAFIRNPFDRGKMEAEAIAQTRLATGIAKAPGVIAFLQALMETEQPTLVFAHHHAVHDLISDALDKFEPALITGRETVGQKDAAQKRFMAGATNLCLIALRAATGLDGLQGRARVVVFAEFDWSPAVHWQAEDRAHRMGQRDSVLAYYLTTDLGTDPAMLATLHLKESQFIGLMQDRKQTEDDAAIAQAAAEEHKASVLRMLRGGRL